MFTYIQKILLISILFVPFYGVPAQAAPQRIDCPAGQVQTRIVTPLPAGWWETPQIGNVANTKIADIGGKPTLMCGYNAFGTVVYTMKEAPVGTECVAESNGFTCTPTTPAAGLIPVIPGLIQPLAPAPVTYKTGPVSLRQTWSVDLDTGTTGSGAGVDIWFEAVTAAERYLVPRNGASMAIAGNRSINLAGCKAIAGYTRARLPVALFRTGLYVCVRTNEGRYSQFRVNSAAGPSPATMEIGFTTWAN